MAAMGFFSFHPFQGSVYPCLAIVLSLVLLLMHFHRQRVGRQNKNAELRWFSELHLFGKARAESPDPKQMLAPSGGKSFARGTVVMP
jgi:hypothetical protein